jgi:exonuclease SbcD
MIEAKPAAEVEYKKIALKEGRPVLRKTFDSVDDALVWLDKNPEALVELTLVSDEFLNSEDSRRILAAHEGILDIVPQLRNKMFSTGRESTEIADPELDKMTLFTSFFKQIKGQEPSEELKELFYEILNS